LAEDNGNNSKVFKQGYDAAYDWAFPHKWVSQWSWAYDYSSDPQKEFTIFNYPDASQRGKMLDYALFDEGDHPSRLLRFIYSNDLPSFISNHSLKQKKMAAALLFAIPGIPMLYNGQTRGVKRTPYSEKPIFKGKTIKQSSQYGLFSYYQKLIRLHKEYPAL